VEVDDNVMLAGLPQAARFVNHGRCEPSFRLRFHAMGVILSRADGEELVLSLSKEPRQLIATVRISKEDPIAGVRSLSVLGRIGMTAALSADDHG
jgi:hypothetical protein